MSVTNAHLSEMQKWAQDPDAWIEVFKNELEKAEKQHDEDFATAMKDYEAKMKVNPKMAEYFEKVKAKLTADCESKKAKAREQYGATIEEIQKMPRPGGTIRAVLGAALLCGLCLTILAWRRRR